MRTERLAGGLLAAALLVGVAQAAGGTEAAFAVSTANPGNSMSSAPDWLPPQITRAVVSKSEGGIPGYVRQSGQYRAYAAATDNPASNPAAGVAVVTGGITGLPDMTLAAGSAVVSGLTYTHQTALQPVPAYAPEGTYSGWVRAQDAATPANTSADLGVSFVVDNTAPAGTVISIANGGTIRRPDAGDRVTFTWGDVVDPHSVVAGWTGAAMNVTVRITNSTTLGGDVLTVWNAANGAQLPLGQVVLGGNYVTATTNFGASGAATRSRLSWSSATGNVLSLVLGPPNVSGNVVTGSTTTGTVTWTPSSTVYDRAGNGSSTATVTESGIADREF